MSPHFDYLPHTG